jgi:hypothetical protein
MVKLMKHQRNPYVKHFEGGKKKEHSSTLSNGESEPMPHASS